MKRLFAVLMCVGLVGCVGMEINPAINAYKNASSQIQLGDNKEKVLAVLQPTQKTLLAQEAKSPEAYMRDGKKVEIYYFRSGWTSDGLTTDDEFTPYAFTDGVLTSIGWTAIGGPKTHGQVVQPPAQINQTTIVN